MEELSTDLVSFFRLADSLLPGLLFKNRHRISDVSMCALVDDIAREYTKTVSVHGGTALETTFDDYTLGGTVFKKSPGAYLSGAVVFATFKFQTKQFSKLRDLIVSPSNVTACSDARIHTIFEHNELWTAFIFNCDIRRELFFISTKLTHLFSPNGPVVNNNDVVRPVTNEVDFDYLKKIVNKESACGNAQTGLRYDTFTLTYANDSPPVDNVFVIDLSLRNIFNQYDQDLKRSFQPFLSDLNDVNYKTHVSRFLNSVSEKYFLPGFPTAIHPLLVASKDKQEEMETILSLNDSVRINTANDVLLNRSDLLNVLRLATNLERDNATPVDMDQIRALSTKALITMLVQAQLVQVHTKSVFSPSVRTHWHNYPDNFAFVNK
uniref:Uncharacterized protein n=1 Tax=Cacopsylla melanoneura TaxID=428564 RepID=A0A8D8XI27_9HEMI